MTFVYVILGKNNLVWLAGKRCTKASAPTHGVRALDVYLMELLVFGRWKNERVKKTIEISITSLIHRSRYINTLIHVCR